MWPTVSHISKWRYWLHECAWEGALHPKRSPKCGILSSKLRSPVFKGRRRRWGCGSVRAVSVWPAHVTCPLLRAMAVAKEQVVMSVGVWVGVVRYVHRDHRQMHWTVVSSASHKGNAPRGLFFSSARVLVLLELVYWERGPRKVCNLCKMLEFLGIIQKMDAHKCIRRLQDLKWPFCFNSALFPSRSHLCWGHQEDSNWAVDFIGSTECRLKGYWSLV